MPADTPEMKAAREALIEFVAYTWDPDRTTVRAVAARSATHLRAALARVDADMAATTRDPWKAREYAALAERDRHNAAEHRAAARGYRASAVAQDAHARGILSRVNP